MNGMPYQDIWNYVISFFKSYNEIYVDYWYLLKSVAVAFIYVGHQYCEVNLMACAPSTYVSYIFARVDRYSL